MESLKKPEKLGLKLATEDPMVDSPARRTTIRDKTAKTTVNDLNSQFPLKKNYNVNLAPEADKLKKIDKNKIKDIEMP